jgi:hypothetical protein
MSIKLKLLALSLLISLSGCATITVTEKGDPNFLYRPHYNQTKNFFLWGTLGEHRIDTQKICGSRPVVQMQTRYEPLDVLYAALTLGIYMPRTAKVWCQRADTE